MQKLSNSDNCTWGTVAVRSEYLRQIDYVVESTENQLGARRYKSRNAFVNIAVAELLQKEQRQRKAAAVERVLTVNV